MSWDKSVFSSMVQSVGWNDETQEIIVTWANGRSSAYAGGSEELADELANAPSVGSMINNQIKPGLRHRYI